MKVGVLGIVLVIGAFFVPSTKCAASCLDYEPTAVTIQGSVSLVRAYGPPGFGEDLKHDFREDYLALSLDPPVCTNSTPYTDNVDENNIKTFFTTAKLFKRLSSNG